MLRILISAYACEPGKGSEGGVGWNQVRQVARFHEAWVITRSNNRKIIEEALNKEPMPNVHWIYFDLPSWARFWKKGTRGLRFYYFAWQLGVYFIARRLHQRVQFDLAHHVTFVNYWMPTFLAFLPIPFIWGPVGGGESTPPGFRRGFGFRGMVYEVLRDCAQALAELNPLVRLTARRSAIALATTVQTETRLRALGCRRAFVFPAVGLPLEELHELGSLPRRRGKLFRLISLGRILHWKGFEFGLRAFAQFHADFPESEYWLIGDGPERKRLERLTRELGIQEYVVFWGTVSREQALARLAECDALMFPSFHDSGGWVSLEAMAAGRPVICLDLGGPGLQVTDATGIKVKATSRRQVIQDLNIALAELAGNAARRGQMGQAARERVYEQFNCDTKGDQMAALYEDLATQMSPPRAFEIAHDHSIATSSNGSHHNRRLRLLEKTRVLISAYACEPGKGSEGSVGWNQVRQVARFHEAWVITRSNNRKIIEEALNKEPMPNVHWIYFDLPSWARFWKKGTRGLRFYYFAWQLGVYFIARRLHQRVQFDLAHHVTFVNYWMPIFLPLLPIPFIWGPVGGGESTPPGFRRGFSFRGMVYEVLRDCARTLGELNPLVRLTARRSVIALATTVQTETRLRALGCRNVSVFSALALPASELRGLMALPIRQSTPFRAISVGRFIHVKGFEFGLRAFAQFHADFPESEYWLIGDGPERKRLERLTRELGIQEHVVFWGTVSREQVFERLAECDVLMFPSLHDSGGWVSLEAMAAGRPVICLDLGGPALQVAAGTGFKIPAVTPDQVVSDLTEALTKIASNQSLRIRLGKGARARAKEYFSGEKKGDDLAKIYASATTIVAGIDYLAAQVNNHD